MTARAARENAPPPSPGRQRALEDFGLVAEAPPSPVPEERPAALPGVWEVRDGMIIHPYLKDGELRALPFQIEMGRIALDHDTLIVLPTGLGKTVIAGLVAAEVLRRGPGKILFLAPTRPLVQQHADTFGRWFRRLTRARFTGTVSHPQREGAWDSAEAVFATPEIVVNDLAAGRVT